MGGNVISLSAIQLPATGLIRLRQIIGDPKADPPVPAIIPVARSTFLAGVRSGRYPQPVKTLGGRITAWRCADILALVDGSWSSTGKQADK
jgi:prophage regulatory protein